MLLNIEKKNKKPQHISCVMIVYNKMFQHFCYIYPGYPDHTFFNLHKESEIKFIINKFKFSQFMQNINDKLLYVGN